MLSRKLFLHCRTRLWFDTLGVSEMSTTGVDMLDRRDVLSKVPPTLTYAVDIKRTNVPGRPQPSRFSLVLASPERVPDYLFSLSV